MRATLQGKKVAILVSDGFEQVEMTDPRDALTGAGAEAKIVSPRPREVQGWNHDEKADKFAVDVALKQAKPEEFDALLLPGGVMNPDTLRIDEDAVRFIKHFVDSGKPIAAICHGPWTLIEAGGGGGPHHDLVQVDQERPRECRCDVGRRGGGGRPRVGHQPHPGRPAGL
jgi:protease I